MKRLRSQFVPLFGLKKRVGVEVSSEVTMSVTPWARQICFERCFSFEMLDHLINAYSVNNRPT